MWLKENKNNTRLKSWWFWLLSSAESSKQRRIRKWSSSIFWHHWSKIIAKNFQQLIRLARLTSWNPFIYKTSHTRKWDILKEPTNFSLVWPIFGLKFFARNPIEGVLIIKWCDENKQIKVPTNCQKIVPPICSNSNWKVQKS